MSAQAAPPSSPAQEALGEHLQSLKTAFSAKDMPVFVGAFAVDAKDLVLYYGKPGPKDTATRLDFIDVSEDALRDLAEFCEPATFGRNSEAVHDETYRKAGKLDVEHFCTKFCPGVSGLLDQVQDLLLEGHKDSVGLRTELYKLNVYGPGSFFKVHKDTPRADDMFASLVVVLPTPHDGGALNFQHNDHSFRFDSADALSQAKSPSVAYAAFFSDVDHEVEVVQTGHRVTLTYNLYYASAVPRPRKPSVPGYFESRLKASLEAALHDSSVLPKGGLLGFCLRHQYTAATVGRSSPTKRPLKGSDAILARVCADLGLASAVYIIYKAGTGPPVLCPRPVRLPTQAYEEEELYSYLLRKRRGWLIDEYYDEKPRVDIVWVTERRAPGVEPHKDLFATYGNEPSVDVCYSYMCFVVELLKFEDGVGRTSAKKVKKEDKST